MAASTITLPGAPPAIYAEWEEDPQMPVPQPNQISAYSDTNINMADVTTDLNVSVVGAQRVQRKPLSSPVSLNPYEHMIASAAHELDATHRSKGVWADDPGAPVQIEIAAVSPELVPSQSPRSLAEPHYSISISRIDSSSRKQPLVESRELVAPPSEDLSPPPPSLSATKETHESTPPDSSSSPSPDSCIVCAEDFSAVVVLPDGWVAEGCSHAPSVCTGCLARCIRTDLATKRWDQLSCPECRAALGYHDVRRHADAATFLRYEQLCVRSTIADDPDFVWCASPAGCAAGQSHLSGAAQPIVRCQRCGFRACFAHRVAWHERLTCAEYDALLRDPDGFRSAAERSDAEAARAADARAAQEAADAELAARLVRSEAQREEQQQRAEARAAQESRRREAEAEREREHAEADRLRREELKRRRAEEALSSATVKKTTKPCPKCKSPIEKRDGCDHMKCVHCQYDFCWRCMEGYHANRCTRSFRWG